MTIGQEKGRSDTRNEAFINSVLASRFELSENGINQTRLLSFLADTIQQRSTSGVKVISFVGGAASGKTTLSKHLVERLGADGVNADFISTDDYVIGDRAYRREHFEGKEPHAKYDFKLMNQHINAICSIVNEDETVAVPTYNQATGVAIAEGEKNYSHRIGKVAVLIVEGDFPEVKKADLSFYLHVPDEQRLENRIGRDVLHRSEADRDKIIDNFNLRQQAQHNPYTLPAIEKADFVISADASHEAWTYAIYHAREPAA